MCGIAGVCLTPGQAVKSDLLQGFLRALAHRGPDGEGSFVADTVGLVHRRLSIIDVAGGAQPITDRTGELTIIGNGEIYNYKAINAELAERNIAPRTGSDIEAALHMYRAHGLDFVRHLSGMYALALYDARSGEVVLARDPSASSRSIWPRANRVTRLRPNPPRSPAAAG